jgi:predicted amino acid racemase
MYPRVEIDLKKLRHNIDEIVARCRELHIEVAGVVKGFTGIPECTKQFDDSNCRFIATSRLEQVEDAKKYGITKEFMLIRAPMITEAADAIRLTDISLHSEIEVLKAFNEQALKQKKKHGIILMADLGDLREGFWDTEEMISAALMVENSFEGLELSGVGTNLG